MKLICDHCGIEFKTRCRKQKCCSLKCKREILMKLDVQALSEFAQAGATVVQMSDHFKVARQTIRFTMLRNGIHRDWQLRRYKKAQHENQR